MKKTFSMRSKLLVLLCAVFFQSVIERCEANCPVLPVPTNGRVTYDRSPSNGNYPLSTIAMYSCEVGYLQSGGRLRVCLDSGWVLHGGPPNCAQEGNCPELSLPNGGIGVHNFAKGPKILKIAFFICNKGYYQKSKGDASCISPLPGKWYYGNYSYPQIHYVACIATCYKYTFLNGRVDYTRTPFGNSWVLYGTIATLTCNSGFTRSGSRSVFCNYFGAWNESVTCNPFPSPPGCFPSSSKVLLETGKSVSMCGLQIGDRVQTLSSTGELTFSEVTTFLKKQSYTVTLYKSTVTVNETLSLTGNHLVYARKTIDYQFNPIYADQLSIGDEVLIDKNDEMVPEKLINISNVILPGAYVPLTIEGKIIVDGVLASCYPESSHDLAHLTMKPLQRFSAVMEFIFGEDAGFPVYVSIARDFGLLTLPKSL